MTGLNWGDPRTFWLNLTNLALGLVTLAAVLGVAATVIADVLGTSPSSSTNGRAISPFRRFTRSLPLIQRAWWRRVRF